MPETSASGVAKGPFIGMGTMACSGGGVGVTSLRAVGERLDRVRAAILEVVVEEVGDSNSRQPEVVNTIIRNQKMARGA